MDSILSNESLHEWKSYIDSMYETKSLHIHPPTNLLEEWWLKTVVYFGDFYLVMAFYMFMNCCYAFGGILFWICDKFRLLHKYKIQQSKYPTATDYLWCLWNLVQNYILIIFPIIYLSYPIFTILKFSSALPLPSLFTFCWQFLFCMVAEDFAHYWLHRVLHWPYFYKMIHKIHHTYASPFGLTASYAHPIEVLILGFCTFCGPFLVTPYFFTFYCWVLFRQLDAVATHSGYDLPNVFAWLPYHGGAVVHDYHHKSFIFNYGSRFTYLDKMFGTFRDPTKEKDS